MPNKTKNSSPKRFFYNGLCAASSSLLLRFTGMVFNVFLSNSAGAETMGLLSLIYSVWGFILTAGCAGGALASSRLCASSRSLGENEFISAKRCLFYSLCCGTVVGTLFFISAPLFGKLLSESRTVFSLRILALSLPFISMSGSLSGYFDSTDNAYKNAVVRITEQILKIAVTVLILKNLAGNDPESNCIAIIFGGAFAETLSFLLHFSSFKREERKSKDINLKSSVKFKSIATITLPITASAGFRSGLVSIEHILIPKGLLRFGYTSKESLELFGVVHGMALPVILFCIAIPSAFATLLIPNFTKYHTKKNTEEIKYIALRAYRAAFIFSIGVAGYIVLSSYLLGEILYPGTDSASYIYVFAPLIPVMYVDSVSDSLLKGTGEQLYSMKINILDAAISVLLVFLLVPKIGIIGYVIAVYASETFNTCMSFVRVFRLTNLKIPIFRFLVSPLIAAVVSANLSSFIYKYFYFLDNTPMAVVGGIFFTAIYILILNVSGNVSGEERNYLKRIVGI